jgi:hypothetical protein
VNVSKQKAPTFFRQEAVAYRYRARWGYIRREKVLNGIHCIAALVLACALLLLVFKILVPGFNLGFK